MNTFYGRKNELSEILDIYRKLSGPEIILINGPCGTGKTRLIYEFYNAVARNSPFWKPVEVTNSIKEIELIPLVRTDMQQKSVKPGKPDIGKVADSLFLVTRALEKKGSVNDYDFCFDKIRKQFSLYIKPVLELLSRKEKNKRIAKSSFALLMNFALPGSSDIIEILNQAKDYLTGSFDALDLIGCFQEKYTKNKDTNALQDSILAILHEIFSVNRDFKITIIIEDAHWIDQYSLEILRKIYQKAQERSWKLLILLAGWEEPLKAGNVDYSKTYSELTEYISANGGKTLHLERLCENFQHSYIKELMGELDDEACRILTDRAQGDMDFLNDLISEIKETPGWFADGKLEVSNDCLKTLPSKAIELAREKIQKYPGEIKEILYWSSLQGMHFDERFISYISHRFSTGTLTTESLMKTDTEYGLTFLSDDELLSHIGEFRRSAVYEACLNIISRNPRIIQIRIAMLEFYVEFYKSGNWTRMSAERKYRFISLFDELCRMLDIHNEIMENIMTDLHLYLMAHKLAAGDYHTALSIGNKLLSGHIKPQFTDRLYGIMADAWYYAGKYDEEGHVYKEWSGHVANQIMFNLKYAKFLRRHSEAKKSEKILSESLGMTDDTLLQAEIRIELLKSEWAQGKTEKAYSDMTDFISSGAADSLQDSLRLKYAEAAYLILHDNEKNRQAALFAKECIDRYLVEGNNIQSHIYEVNWADALWGTGQSDMARDILLETIRHAKDRNLIHIMDIAFICLANIYSSCGQYAEAAENYHEGINLAKKISHDWDYCYGCIYYNLHKIRTGEYDAYCHSEITDEYNYLKELNQFLDIYLTYNKGLRVPDNISFTVPAAIINYRAVLFWQEQSYNNAEDFICAVSSAEGIKFNRDFIVKTLNKVLDRYIISNISTTARERLRSSLACYPEADHCLTGEL